jgi:outer membrane lipoprotein-sorting protein
VSNVLRRLSLTHLLLLCGTLVVVGAGAAALALAVAAGPVPPPKPLAQAVHDALSSSPAAGVSARIQLTNHLLEGSELAGEGAGGESSQLSSSPLISGGSGRLWIGSEGRARLELQSEKGDTQILYDGHRLSLYDASTNTLYRYTPVSQTTQHGQDSSGESDSNQGAFGHDGAGDERTPSVAEIQEGIGRLSQHADLSEATPTDVAGQPAYTVRVSPREHGGLVAGAELSFDAVHGAPLRAAVYSTSSSSPTIELAASEVSYGSVASSTLDFTPPASAKIEDVTLPSKHDSSQSTSTEHGHVRTHGQGLDGVAILESPVKPGKQSGDSQMQGLQKVKIGATEASELPTALGTLLSFERAGVRYLLVGSVTPSTIEAFARSL